MKEEFTTHGSQKEGARPTTPGHLGKHQSGSERVRRAREGKRGPAPLLWCPQEGMDKAGQSSSSSGLGSLDNVSSKLPATGGSSLAPGQFRAGGTLAGKGKVGGLWAQYGLACVRKASPGPGSLSKSSKVAGCPSIKNTEKEKKQKQNRAQCTHRPRRSRSLPVSCFPFGGSRREGSR